MSSAFSWQNSISLCPASFHIVRHNTIQVLFNLCLPGYSTQFDSNNRLFYFCYRVFIDYFCRQNNMLSMKLWRKKTFMLVLLLPLHLPKSQPQLRKCLGKMEKALHFYEIFWERDYIHIAFIPVVVDVVQLLSPVPLFATPWTAVRQAHLSFTIFQSLLKLMSIESVILSNHLILCRLLLHLPSIIPSIGVFSNKSALCTRWPKY